jgi:hypothetical protein
MARDIDAKEALVSTQRLLQTATNHPDLLQSGTLNYSFAALASREVIEKMPTKDVAALFVALQEQSHDAGLDGVRGDVETVLNKRIHQMQERLPLTLETMKGLTPAGEQAAYVNQLTAIKDDVEVLSLLASQSGMLPREGQAQRHEAIETALANTRVRLVEIMTWGVQENVPSLLSSAINVAKLSYAALLDLKPKVPPSEFQKLMADSMQTKGEKGFTLREGGLQNNVIRKVAFILLRASDKVTSQLPATEKNLFDDEEGIPNLYAEMKREKAYAGEYKAVKELTEIEGMIRAIEDKPMTQKEAASIAKSLEKATKSKINVASLRRETDVNRAGALIDLLKPTLKEVRQQTVNEVNAARARITSAKNSL